MRAMVLVVCVCGLVMATGCGKRQVQPPPPPESPSPEAIAQQRLNELQAELMSMKTNGQDAVVLTRLQAEVANSVMAPVKGTVFSWLMSEMVSQGLTNEVRDAYLATVGSDETLTRAGFGIVDSVYQQVNDWAGLLAWSRLLLERGLPADLATRAWMQVVRSLHGQGSLGAVVEDVPRIVTALPEVDAERVVSLAFQLALQDTQYGPAEAIASAAGEAGAGKPALERFARLSRIDVMLASDRLADAEAQIWTDAASLADNDLSPRAGRLMAAWRKGGNAGAETAFARRVLAEWAQKPMSRDAVGSAWVLAAIDDKNRDAFMDRIGACAKAQVRVARLLSPFEAGFYDTMSKGSEEQRKRCRDLAAELQAQPSVREYEITRLTLMRLDGAFYANDFKAALELVKAGIPGYDADWHAVLTNKIAAHMALAENRPEDAIRCFRNHMEKVAAWERPEQNPENGLLMHKETVLGFNEKRIGDIYASMGRAEDAAASYRRAREYYKQALEQVSKDSEEYAAYTKELAEVPVQQ